MAKKRNPSPRDVNARPFQIVQEAYEPGAPDVMKNPHAVALGRMGGLIGGAARAAALSPAKRKRIAAKAARARWAK